MDDQKYIIESPKKLTRDQIEYIREAFQQNLPGCKALILEDGVTAKPLDQRVVEIETENIRLKATGEIDAEEIARLVGLLKEL